MNFNTPQISFGSTYNFYVGDKTGDIELDAMKYASTPNSFVEKEINDMDLMCKGIYGRVFVNIPNWRDKKFEKLLAKANVEEFQKSSLKDTLSQDNIISRIELDDYDLIAGRELAKIDVVKFDELFAKSDLYIGKKGKGGIDDRYKRALRYFSTGANIHASKVTVYTDDFGKPQVTFIDGRHRYSVMRDMGIKEIPVSMNFNSRQVTKRFGLLAK